MDDTEAYLKPALEGCRLTHLQKPTLEILTEVDLDREGSHTQPVPPTL